MVRYDPELLSTYLDKIDRECRHEGVYHETSLKANLKNLLKTNLNDHLELIASFKFPIKALEEIINKYPALIDHLLNYYEDREEIIACGKKALELGQLKNAIKAYRLTESQEIYEQGIETTIQEGDISGLKDIFDLMIEQEIPLYIPVKKELYKQGVTQMIQTNCLENLFWLIEFMRSHQLTVSDELFEDGLNKLIEEGQIIDLKEALVYAVVREEDFFRETFNRRLRLPPFNESYNKGIREMLNNNYIWDFYRLAKLMIEDNILLPENQELYEQSIKTTVQDGALQSLEKLLRILSMHNIPMPRNKEIYKIGIEKIHVSKFDEFTKILLKYNIPVPNLIVKRLEATRKAQQQEKIRRALQEKIRKEQQQEKIRKEQQQEKARKAKETRKMRKYKYNPNGLKEADSIYFRI